jgi:glycosyltransferase involved in cell wall biosynthesis
MRRLIINAVSCKIGGGVNDLAHTLPLLDEALRKTGWEIRTYVVEPGWASLRSVGYDMERVTLVNAASPFKRAFWELVRLPRLVQEISPRVVFHFSNFIPRNLRVPQLTVLRSRTFFSPEYAAGQRTGSYQRVRYWAGCRLSAATIRKADRIYCISDTHRKEIVQTVGPIAEKVEVSYVGLAGPREQLILDANGRATVLAELPAKLRAELGPLQDSHRPIIVNVAHYYEQKNLSDLLQAVALLRNKYPNVALVLTAGLTQYQGPQNARTQHDTQLAKQLAEEGVLFDLGPVPKDTVWPLLTLADVFAFPSSLESFGHPLLEAMLMGTPVVAADTPVHREIAADAALFHETGNPTALAARIDLVLSSEIDVASQIEKGRQRAASFSWESHVDTLCDAIVSIAGN